MSNYCSAIDVGLFVYTTGKVKTCCSGNEDLGDVNSESIDKIFTKNRFIEIRNNLHNNIQDSYCSGCSTTEAVSPTATQKYAFNNEFGYQKDRNLKFIDIRWSNVCNLMCRYCNITDSSEWSKKLNIPIPNVNKKYNDSLFDLVAKNASTITNVYLLGGEPLLQVQNLKLLDLLDKNVKIDILTNLSVPLNNNQIYKKLLQFSNVHWNLSFDNVDQRFEYVRHGADWAVFKGNLDRLKKDFSKNIVCHPVYSIWNALNLNEYYQFADFYKLPVSWQLALPREDLSDWSTDSFIVFGHNHKIIESAINEIDRVNRKDLTLNDIRSKLIDNITRPNKNKEFLTYIEKLETLVTSVNTFNKLWPDLYSKLKTD